MACQSGLPLLGFAVRNLVNSPLSVQGKEVFLFFAAVRTASIHIRVGGQKPRISRSFPVLTIGAGCLEAIEERSVLTSFCFQGRDIGIFGEQNKGDCRNCAKKRAERRTGIVKNNESGGNNFGIIGQRKSLVSICAEGAW